MRQVMFLRIPRMSQEEVTRTLGDWYANGWRLAISDIDGGMGEYLFILERD